MRTCYRIVESQIADCESNQPDSKTWITSSSKCTYCWFPKVAPMLPPLNTRSVMRYYNGRWILKLQGLFIPPKKPPLQRIDFHYYILLSDAMISPAILHENTLLGSLAKMTSIIGQTTNPHFGCPRWSTSQTQYLSAMFLGILANVCP